MDGGLGGHRAKARGTGRKAVQVLWQDGILGRLIDVRKDVP